MRLLARPGRAAVRVPGPRPARRRGRRARRCRTAPSPTGTAVIGAVRPSGPSTRPDRCRPPSTAPAPARAAAAACAGAGRGRRGAARHRRRSHGARARRRRRRPRPPRRPPPRRHPRAAAPTSAAPHERGRRPHHGTRRRPRARSPRAPTRSPSSSATTRCCPATPTRRSRCSGSAAQSQSGGRAGFERFYGTVAQVAWRTPAAPATTPSGHRRVRPATAARITSEPYRFVMSTAADGSKIMEQFDRA